MLVCTIFSLIRLLDMSSIASQPETQKRLRASRIVVSILFFALSAWLGAVASQVLWQRYGGTSLHSFGFVLNVGIFRLHEPASSWFVLVCCACLLWGGCSVLRLRRGLRLGAIVAAICFSVLVVSFLA